MRNAITIKLNCEQLFNLIKECIDYKDCETDIEQKESYIKELKNIENSFSNDDKWDALLTSGIFHDACGKILSTTHNTVTYCFDY